MYSADAPTTGRVCSIMFNQGSAGGDGIQFDVYGVNYAIGVARDGGCKCTRFKST